MNGFSSIKDRGFPPELRFESAKLWAFMALYCSLGNSFLTRLYSYLTLMRWTFRVFRKFPCPSSRI